MAFILLRLLVLGVIAAAADDVQVTWSSSPRAWLPCVLPEAQRLQRRPPPPLEADDKARPRPYLWRRGNDEFSAKRVSANGTLEVSRKQPGAEGVYQCAVRHQGGLVLGYPVRLKFAYLDKRSSANTRQDVDRPQQPVVLSCGVSSAPSADVYWTKDDEIITDDDRYLTLSNQLVIMDTTSAADGMYRCSATNLMLNKTRTRDVAFVRTGEESELIPPSLLPVQYEEDIVVVPGSRVILPCPVSGRPKPKISWLVRRGDRTSMLETTNEVLVIGNVRPRDEGIYTCTVDKTELKRIFNVTVFEPVMIKLPPAYKEELRARTVRFNCTATGNPKPTISWYKDGKLLQLGGRYNLRKSPKDNSHEDREELVVGGVMSDDAGVYQCFADNGLSVASSWAVLKVTGEVADPPRNAACLPTGPKSVLFKWEPPERLDVIAYTVQTSFPGNTSPGDLTSSPGQPHTNTEENVTVAKSLTPYGFQVLAIVKTSSKSIPSTWTDSVICQGQGVPIQLSRAGDHNVEVSWKLFSEENPGIVQWILQYRRNETTERNITLAGNVTTYSLPATTSEPLQLRVLGSRFADWLPQNLSLVPWISSNDLDHGKENLVPVYLKVSNVGAHEFTLSWRCAAPSRDHSYLVCVTNDDGYKKCVSSDREWATIDNLDPETEYEARVQLQVPGNQVERQFSQPVHIMTQPSASGRFKDLSYKFLNASTLLVTWSATSPRFTVYYTDKFYTPIEQWNRVDTKETSVVINGIDRTKKTVLQVTAYDPMEASKPIVLSESEIRDVQFSYVRGGVLVRWAGAGARGVRYSQNLTRAVDAWARQDARGNEVELNNLDPSLMTYVIVVTPGSTDNSHVLSIPPQANVNHNSYYLGIGIPVGMCILCSLVLAAVCIWRRRKITRSPARPRRRNVSPNQGDEEGASEMKSVGGALANGGGRDAGEPLLNGHVHITENPQSKAPNGKMRRGRLYVDAFDLSRCEEDADATQETVLDELDASGAFGLLDTSRRPEDGLDDYHKLPDDNMNSELTRSTDIHTDNSQIQPTLQPNG